MQRARGGVAAVFLVLLFSMSVVAAPPKVVKAVPDNGDIGVDPNLKEITITFDQPMAEGMSPVGGGETFPKILGKPRWTTARTLTIRVKLEPNHEYWLSANNEKFRNFTNRAGEPAIPYPIKFRTGRAKRDSGKTDKKDDTQPSDSGSLTGEQNRAAIVALRAAILNYYSYRDRLKIDWDGLFQTNESALLAATSPEEFADLAATMLSKVQDKHIWFQVGDHTVPSFVRPPVKNANYKLLPQLVPGLAKHGKMVVSGQWDDGIGYLAIATWDRDKLNAGKPIFEALDQLAKTKALIIDVRANGGGAEPLAQEVAGCFVSERKLYGKHVYRDASTLNGFTTPPNERWLEPNANRPHYAGRVAVLSGPVVMSSCESFLLMMKQVPGTVIVGATSQGASGNPKPFDLGNGVTVMLPSWKDMTAEGKELEGVGIAPDIAVNATAAEFESSDPVLAAALAHLRKPATK
jgi:hypothetical protein